MPINGSNDVKLPSLLKTLESPTTGEDEKVEAYKIFSDQIQEDELSFFDLDITYYIEPIVSVLNEDILNKSELVQQGALQVLGFCLHDLELVRLISIESQKNLLLNLCKCLKMAEDKATSTRGLWILSKQNIQPDLIVQELEMIMSSINFCLTKWKGQAQTIEYEAVNAIARLNMQAGKEMNNKMKWEKICFSLLIHPSIKVREKALITLEKGCEQGINKTTMKEIIPEFKSKISGELKKLFNNNEQFVLKVWCFLVKYFGEELHQGSFINCLLPIVEMGFKTLEPDVKIMSFKAWKELINNFAMNPSIISDPRRVKLIMQVFKVNNAKVEIVAKEKFHTWIFYISKLGAKASVNFDQVVVPLLQFCTGGNKLNTSTSYISTPTTPRFGVKNTSISIVSPTTPRLSITSTPSQLSTFKTLQLKGVEVLAQILGMSNYNYTTDVTMPDVITSPMFFLKQSTVLISCFRELVMSLGSEIPEDLLLATWSALVGHVKVAVDITPKSDHKEMFSYFLSQFQFIALVENISHLLLKMFDPVCNIPLKVLSSNVYSVGSGEVMGTPALFLCEILLSPIFMQSLAQNERYMTIYGKLVNCGFTITTGTLEFSQSVVDIIDRHSQYLPNIELLWRLWSVIANRLLEHIIKTSEINQGDSLEYDFTCLYTALILPIKHKIGSQVSQTVCKSVMKTWSDLYRCFSRQAALVTTAEDNVVCEDFCSRIINSLSTEELKEPSLIDFIVQILQVVLDCVNFSALSGALTGSFSPGKRWMKHKQKPLENLHSFLHLFTDLLNNSIDISEHSANTVTFFSKQKSTPSITVAINGLVDIVTTLVTHITSSNIISNMFHKIAEPVSRLYNSSTNTNGTKLYTSAFYQKLEKLWLDISTCLQSRYTSIYDSDFLAKISPLLEATFLHSRRTIKNQTILFWNSTFSKSSTLTYPDSLKNVLVKVKEKTPINLPGWVNVETTIIDETPVSQSQFSQMDAPEPHLPGMPSPHKLRGSFLNKAVSPNIKHSPLKHPTYDTKPVNSAKKKLAIDGLTNNDYVVIKASPNKPRILTEHQKEALKEKGSIPVMYNNLDQSQSLDISILQHFNSQSQSQTGSVIEVEPSQSSDDVIVIPSSQSESSQQTIEEKMKSPETSTKPAKDDSVEFKQPTRGRRRSVRFSWDEDEIKSSQERSSSEKSEDNKSGQKVDFVSPPLSSSLKQNVEGAIGVGTFETTGSKSSSSPEEAGDETAKSPEEAGSQSVLSSRLPTDESSHSSVFLINKSSSQSPKHAVKHSPKRKTSSQESRSTSKSPQRNSTSKFNLDSWVVRSPSKGFLQDLGTEDDKEEEATSSKILSETLVEDTQSPTNFQRSNNILENTNVSPTPSCNLFETSGVASVPDSPEAVPDSPEPLPNAVVKIQKLTKMDLEKYSTGADDNSTSSSDSEIQFSINKVANDIGGSQGFVSNSAKLERSDSYGFFTKDSCTELDDIAPTDSARGISQLLTASQKDQLENVNTDDSMLFGVSQSQSLLKSEVASEKDNQEKEFGYDPTTENTLKDTMSQDSKKSELNSDSQTQKNSQQSSSCGSQSDSDYDPTKVSTLDEDHTKKKRKQMTPKKSPVVLTPRRTPRRHKKRKHFDIEGKDETNVVDSSNEKLQLESITEEKMDVELELPVKLSSSPEASDQQKNDSENLPKDLAPAKKDESKIANEFTEDLLSETMESQKEVTEQTPEGKKPVKEGKRKSTTKEKLAVAKRRSSRMNDEGIKSRKQLKEGSQTTVEKIVAEKDKPSEKEDEKIEKSKDSEDLENIESCVGELEDPDFKASKPTRSCRLKNKEDVTDSQQSSQSSTTSQTSSKKSKSVKSTRKTSNVSSPKTHKLRSSGLVLQTRTLRDGKTITLAKLSPIMKQKRALKTKSAKISKVEDNSDAESEISVQNDESQKDILDKVESSEMMEEKIDDIDETDSAQKKIESAEIDVNNSDVFSSLLTSPMVVNNDSDKSSNRSATDENRKPPNTDDEVTKLKDINENIPINTNKESDKITPNSSVLKSIVKEQENLMNKEKTHSPKRDDETPRKFKHAKKRSLTTLMNSDSKVIGLNRFGSRPLMSARGFNIVRRSILQQRSMTDDQNKSSFHKSASWSPKSSGGHLRSPSASPSTGILKRRLSTNDLHSNSPSPPSKQRRVSFATPIIAGASPSKSVDSINSKPPSPLITNTVTQFTFTGNKFTLGSPSHRRSKHSEKMLEDSETPTSQSQPYKSTDETELSAVGPAFPDYIDCDEPVEKILKHLTSSVWSRGLVQLIKSNAHNINTVGDLCRLSEYEINNLPLRTPKLQTLHTALQTLDYNKQTDMPDNIEKDNNKLETVTEEEDEEELPSADEALQKLADDIHHQSEDCDSEDVLKLSQNSDSDNKTEDITTENSSAMILLDNFLKESDNFSKLSSRELFQLHQKLAMCTNKVMMAMMKKSSFNT